MATPTFSIKSGSSEFLNKQKNLFEVLDLAAKENNFSTGSRDEFKQPQLIKSSKRQRKITKQFRGKESLFHEPVDLPLRFKKNNRMPDFQRNPQKWIKYSLGDITQDDMSNESNTAAAMSFLNDIKMQKLKSQVKMEVDDEELQPNTSNSHQFRLPKLTDIKKEKDADKDDAQTCHKSYFRSNKFVMAEYVVGVTKKSDKSSQKKKFCSREKGKEIFLNHIHEYEDD